MFRENKLMRGGRISGGLSQDGGAFLRRKTADDGNIS